jgi:hypothetical protein
LKVVPRSVANAQGRVSRGALSLDVDHKHVPCKGVSSTRVNSMALPIYIEIAHCLRYFYRHQDFTQRNGLYQTADVNVDTGEDPSPHERHRKITA